MGGGGGGKGVLCRRHVKSMHLEGIQLRTAFPHLAAGNIFILSWTRHGFYVKVMERLSDECM